MRIGWLGPLVPEREQLRGPRRQLRRAVAGQLRRCRRRPVLAVAARVATPHRDLRAPALLDFSEELLGPRGDQSRIRVTAVEPLHGRTDGLIQPTLRT